MARLEERLPLDLGRAAGAEAVGEGAAGGELARVPWVPALIIVVLVVSAVLAPLLAPLFDRPRLP